MWRNLFLLIFVILQVRGRLKEGDPGVCLRGKNNLTACCAHWKYDHLRKICSPVCTFGCGEGRCIQPNTCKCEPPLTYRNKKCEQPECNLPYCTNPTCSYSNGHENECKCSEGYEYKGNYSCAPKCTSGCVNGDCVAPETCSCLEGYRNVSAWECAPICRNCENGECTAPNTCTCNDGYTKRNDRCEPVCRACNNGECVAPDTCRCHDGYQSDDEDKCQPVCTDCGNGKCVAPGDCRCDSGYERRDDRCSPICNSCTNGECILPGVCRCDSGYTRVQEECVPHCAKPCENGFCSAPDTCTCDKGYRRGGDGTCQPICTKNCVNATCVGPDECRCHDGHIKSNDFVCKPKCACDNGRCIDSNGASICMCNEGFNMMHGSCKPVCSNACVNGVCAKPDVCVCAEGYSSNSTHPWLCTKPCVPCDFGVCNTHGECICHPGYEYTNSSCSPLVVNCAACESFCNETGCWCSDSRRCDKPIEARIDSPTSTGLAGLQILWLGGAIGAIVLVTTVIFVFRHMWKRQQEMRSKEISTDAYPYGSVAYTVPGTLQAATGAVSVPNLYSEDNEEDQDQDVDEAADGLLPESLDNV